MIDQTQLPLIVYHKLIIFKYKSILKCNELLTFRIILFVYIYLYTSYIITITLVKKHFVFVMKTKQNVFYH